MKAMKAPPPVIRDTMQAVCYILNPNPTDKMKDKSGLKMVTDWWAASLKVLGNSKLLDEMKNFDKDSLKE
jgi:dynein heavy chain